MSRHLTIRISDAEHDFLERLASQRGITKTAAARHLFLQNLALDGIKAEVGLLLENRFAGVEKQLDSLSEKVAVSASREDLIKAVNFLKEIKK